MLKLYVDGTLEGSAYNEKNRFHEVKKAAITAGGRCDSGGSYMISHTVIMKWLILGEQEGLPKLKLTNDMITSF